LVLPVIQLARVQKRISDRKIKLEVSPGALEFLGSLGYDPNYGARPVKRVIQQYVENELAKGILRGEFKDEDSIFVDTQVTAAQWPASAAKVSFPESRGGIKTSC
jgi:ATP-dependent Clp protease ATP-binding subunit ClpB